MKFTKILIYVILFILYGYSCYMTSADSKRLIWGYICALLLESRVEIVRECHQTLS